MKLTAIWGLLRDIIRNEYSFAQIKDLCGSCGLPVYELAHIQQKFSGGASKGRLMDEIDILFNKLSSDEKETVVKSCIREVASNEFLRERLEENLERFGWGLSDNEPYPLEIKIEIETAEIPEKVQKGISKCLRRFRDGDLSGAMSSICGIVDNLTEDIYDLNNLGDYTNDSYQERISKSFSSFQAKYRQVLKDAGMEEQEINILWNNHKKSISQAGYVLGAYRRGFSDVHGENLEPIRELVQTALDCAVYIIRSLSSVMK